jgi:hypothetical protein
MAELSNSLFYRNFQFWSYMYVLHGMCFILTYTLLQILVSFSLYHDTVKPSNSFNFLFCNGKPNSKQYPEQIGV